MDQDNQNQNNEPIAPSSSPLINPQSVAADQPSPKRANPKKWLLPLIITLVVLLAGGGALAYFYLYNPPDKIVQKMLTNTLLNMKSFEYEAEISGDIDNLAFMVSGRGDLYTTFSGAYNELDPSLPVGRFAMTVREGRALQEQAIFSLETRMNFEALYISLVELSDPGFFDVSNLLSKWIRIDLKDGTWQRTLGMWGIYPIIYEDEADHQDIEEIIKVKLEEFKREVVKVNILSIDKKLPSEKINGVDTHHYAFSINPDGLKELAMAYKKLYGEIIEEIGVDRWEPGSSEDSQWTAEDEKNFNKFVSENKMPNGEIWIGKKDLMPYKITINFESGARPQPISLNLWLKNFNQPIRVDMPTEYVSLEEMLSGLFGGFTMDDQEDFYFDGDWPEGFESSQWNIDADFDFSKDSDQDGLTDYEEIYMYGTDPSNPDTDGDGYLDGEEVESGYNPLGPGTIDQMIAMPWPLPAEFWQQVTAGFFFLPREEIEQALNNYKRSGQLFPDSM